MRFCGRQLWLLLSLIVALGCSEKKTSNEYDNRNSPTYQGPAEESYCAGSSAVANPVTITGTATFQYRTYFGTLMSGGLGAIEGSTKPIRYAEVRAKNSAGTVVQCGETSGTGTFSLDIPKDTGTYTIEVNSRANNSNAKASVLNKPEFNQFYSITTTVSSSATASAGTMTAPATTGAEVIAGAFNILDQIVDANTYLKTQAGSCSSLGCTEFSVAPKVSAYWVAGFNPGSYVGTSSGLSFYLPGYSRLFILGGINGNTTTADTDHFDNSIILHEYGHFLEDQVFLSDSPGGSHDGQSVVDPRLAWSEGWGNFFQGAVQGVARYVDTEGNSDGSTSMIFDANLELNGTSGNAYDVPNAGKGDNLKGYGTDGEGNFREFSVSRALWDAVDTVDDTESINSKFNEIWSVLTNQSWGWMASKWKFQSLGLFQKLHESQYSGWSSSSWSTIRDHERQIASRMEYAQYVTPDNTCAGGVITVTITPNSAASGNPNTDYFNNYDFYHLSLSSTTSGSLTLEYSDNDGSGTKIDLDIRVLDKDGRINNSDDLVAQNLDSNSSSSAGVSETTTATLNSLPAGNYLIQIFSWYGTGTAARYSMKLNGTTLCLKDP